MKAAAIAKPPKQLTIIRRQGNIAVVIYAINPGLTQVAREIIGEQKQGG
jgi:hypothetical protein